VPRRSPSPRPPSASTPCARAGSTRPTGWTGCRTWFPATRIIPKPDHAAEIKKRTLTNLYNARPAWLDNAHKALDAAVAAAYGWDDYSVDMPGDEILHRLLALNLERSGYR
jgi:hypothetical protein